MDYIDAFNEIKDVIIKIYGKDNKYNVALNVLEQTLREKQDGDFVVNLLKDVIQFGRQVINDPKEPLNFIQQIVYRQQRDIENAERKILRRFVINQCFPNEIVALKELAFSHSQINNHIDNTYTIIFDGIPNNKFIAIQRGLEDGRKL